MESKRIVTLIDYKGALKEIAVCMCLNVKTNSETQMTYVGNETYLSELLHYGCIPVEIDTDITGMSLIIAAETCLHAIYSFEYRHSDGNSIISDGKPCSKNEIGVIKGDVFDDFLRMQQCTPYLKQTYFFTKIFRSLAIKMYNLSDQPLDIHLYYPAVSLNRKYVLTLEKIELMKFLLTAIKTDW